MAWDDGAAARSCSLRRPCSVDTSLSHGDLAFKGADNLGPQQRSPYVFRVFVCAE